MAYTTRAKLIERISDATLIQLTDDEGDGTKIDERVEAAISDACGVIDSYLRGRFAIPLSDTAPEPVPSICADIAIFNLYERRGDFLISDKIQERYKRSIKKLEDIQSGKITFLGDGTPAIYSVRQTQCGKTYTSDIMKAY